jgi:hypothetical protein
MVSLEFNRYEPSVTSSPSMGAELSRGSDRRFLDFAFVFLAIPGSVFSYIDTIH